MLSRRVSIYESTSPPRRKSPLYLPKVQRDKSPTVKRGPSPPLTWMRTGSVDATCTTAASAAQSLLASKDTPVWGKTQTLPFPGAMAAMLDERNVIATPSSIGEPTGGNNFSIDESLNSYIGAEIAPKAAQGRRRFQCPTPVPILSSTPDLTDKEITQVIPTVKVPTGKSPKGLGRTKAPMHAVRKGLRLPAVATPLRAGALSPMPGRNITPSPFRANTDMRVRMGRKTDRRSPLHVR